MTMITAILAIGFAIGMPIAWAMIIASSSYMVANGIPLEGMVQRLVGGIDSFPMLAIPFFILAGNLMNHGGITERLVAFARALVGHLTGGLAQVTILTNTLLSGLSGSGVSDAAGSGVVLIPAMKRAGFPASFAAAVTGASATIGPIIPPSINMVVFAALANESVGRLFLAGVGPGVVMCVILMACASGVSWYRGYPRDEKSSWQTLGRTFLGTLLPLGMPVMILGGIRFGVMTPTEAAAAASVYAFGLGFFIYRKIKLEMIPRILVESVVGTAAVVIIIAAAQPIGWILAYMQLPLSVVALFEQLQLSPWQLLLVLNIVLLFMGMFLEGMAIMIMLTPVLMPLIHHAGIDPVHFGVILTLNLSIGMVTPPIGVIMYVVCALGRVSIIEYTKQVMPFLIALIISLAVVTYAPAVSMWLPDLLMPPFR